MSKTNRKGDTTALLSYSWVDGLGRVGLGPLTSPIRGILQVSLKLDIKKKTF